MNPLSKKVLIWVCIFISILYAENGRINGVVYDASTGQPLTAADITILNTSLGSATDENGKFIIPGLKSGTYLLNISYIGYKSVQKKVDLTAGKRIFLQIYLKPVAIDGESIVVTARADPTARSRGNRLSLFHA